jgi:hypothetical protein
MLAVIPRHVRRRAGVAALVVGAVGGIAALSALTLYDRGGRAECRPDRAYAEMVLADGAIGYWRLNDTAGTTAANSAPGGPDGQYVGNHMVGRPGIFLNDAAAALNGSRAYVVIPAHARYRKLTRWSVEAWVDAHSPTPKNADIAFLSPAWHSSSLPFVLGYGSYDGAYADGRHAWAGFYRSSGFYRELLGVWSHIGEVTGTWSRTADPTVLPLDTWTHLVGTYDGRTIRLYKNGVVVSSAAVAGRPPAAGKVPLYIGSRWWLRARQFLAGSVSGVALYPNALKPAQVQKHHGAVREC